MNTKIEQVPLLNQLCQLHTSEQANLICLSTACLHQGFLCKVCRKLHDNHNIIEIREFLEILKRLVNYDGSYKTPNSLDTLVAKTTSTTMAIIEELEMQVEFFTSKLNTLKNQFELYRQISQDVCLLNNLIYYVYGNDSNISQFKEQLQQVLKRMCFQNKMIQISSVVQCSTEYLFIPNENLYKLQLQPILNQLKGIRQSFETKLMSTEAYNILDLKFKKGLDLQQNFPYNSVMFEQEKQNDEELVYEKFVIDKPDNNPFKKLKRYKSETNPVDEPCNQGVGRVEKMAVVAGHKMWYHDLCYLRFKPRNWVIEPRNACIICKCHPKFARIKEFLNCKYGDLYGPIAIDADLFAAFRKAVANRKEKQFLVERNGIYFHDLCVYWSYMVECDEINGKIGFESLCNAVRIAYDKFCYLCKRRGATLKCNDVDCEIWIHYYCWKELDPSQQYLDSERFRMLCFRHAKGLNYKPDWLYSDHISSSIQRMQSSKQFQQIKITHKEQEEEEENRSEDQYSNQFRRIPQPKVKYQENESEN